MSVISASTSACTPSGSDSDSRLPRGSAGSMTKSPVSTKPAWRARLVHQAQRAQHAAGGIEADDVNGQRLLGRQLLARGAPAPGREHLGLAGAAGLPGPGLARRQGVMVAVHEQRDLGVVGHAPQQVAALEPEHVGLEMAEQVGLERAVALGPGLEIADPVLDVGRRHRHRVVMDGRDAQGAAVAAPVRHQRLRLLGAEGAAVGAVALALARAEQGHRGADLAQLVHVGLVAKREHALELLLRTAVEGLDELAVGPELLVGDAALELGVVEALDRLMLLGDAAVRPRDVVVAGHEEHPPPRQVEGLGEPAEEALGVAELRRQAGLDDVAGGQHQVDRAGAGAVVFEDLAHGRGKALGDFGHTEFGKATMRSDMQIGYMQDRKRRGHRVS
nr:hypothetical protein [Haliangium ochraceum]